MGLKKKLSTAPETALAGYYKQISATEWVLDLEGDDLTEGDARLRDFREAGISKDKKISSMESELATLRKQMEETSAKSAPREQETKTLTERLGILEKVLADERQHRATAEKKVRTESFRSEFLSAAQAQKVRDDKAGKALYGIASQTWREENDGTFKPYEGDKLLYSAQKGKETEPMTMNEWMESQKAGDYRDFFSQPVGGGGRGNSAPISTGRMVLTREQSRYPSAEQAKAMAKGDVEIVD